MMFRPRVPQASLLESEFLVPPAKARRLQRTWAEVFRNEVLCLIDEKRFAAMYCEDNGRANRALQTVLGVLILKEFGDLTDEEAWSSRRSTCSGSMLYSSPPRSRTCRRRRCTTSESG